MHMTTREKKVKMDGYVGRRRPKKRWMKFNMSKKGVSRNEKHLIGKNGKE